MINAIAIDDSFPIAICKKAFICLLKSKGLKRWSQSRDDYESAKELANKLCVSSNDFERLIRIVINFVGI